jgi:hypothetical protein
MGAESADFFFDCWYLKVITDDKIECVVTCDRLEAVFALMAGFIEPLLTRAYK